MHTRIVTASLAAALFGLGCGGSTTGDGGSNTTPAVLSKEGESCTRTADCDTDLICIDQKCVTTAPTPAATRLSGRGETCQVTADCDTGLLCWPIMSGTGATGLGRCDLASFGLTPTGKTCDAECKTATDCCEIPLSDQPAADGGVFRSCEDLKAALPTGTTNCETTAPQDKTRECFLYKTYCDCATSNPWTCTNGRCGYVKGCTKQGAEVVGGCPLLSRAGFAQVSACNLQTNTCTNETQTPCTTDSSCDGKGVADDGTDTCSTGECVCVANTGCYRRCRNDLECAIGYVCDTGKLLCVAAGSCTTDATCVKLDNNVLSKCVEHQCKTPCRVDLDCDGSGLAGKTFATDRVCDKGYCTSIGCSEDRECPTSQTGVKMFCQTPPTPSTTTVYHSAITN